MAEKPGRPKRFNDKFIVNVRDDVATAIRSLAKAHHMSESEAHRIILDNGLIYMSIYGDGLESET